MGRPMGCNRFEISRPEVSSQWGVLKSSYANAFSLSLSRCPVRVGAALRALMYNTELVAGLMQTWTPNSPDRQLHIAGWRRGEGVM